MDPNYLILKSISAKCIVLANFEKKKIQKKLTWHFKVDAARCIKRTQWHPRWRNNFHKLPRGNIGIQSNLDISNSDISNSAKFEASI